MSAKQEQLYLMLDELTENERQRLKEQQQQRRKYLRTREHILARQKALRKANPDYYKKLQKEYRDKRRAIFNQRAKEYKIRKGEAYLKRTREWAREKYHTDIDFKLKRTIARGILKLVKRGAKKSKRSERYLGCSIADCRRHLENLWKLGMNWENHGPTGWHIDHIRPLASFDFTQEEQINAALHYTNLQPLWWYENLSKGTKTA